MGKIGGNMKDDNLTIEQEIEYENWLSEQENDYQCKL